MEATEQNKFEGWAVVELFGHAREVGFVTTQAFGTAVLFRVDTPELPEREFELTSPEFVEHKMVPAGSKVKRPAVPARSRLIGPGAVYAINPCTEETALKNIERLIPRPLILLSVPENAAPQLEAHLPGEDGEDEADGEYEDEYEDEEV